MGSQDPGGTGDSSSKSMPNAAAPNNLVCPFWDNLAMGPGYDGGHLFCRTFYGDKRYSVLLFLNMHRIGTDTTDLLSFEVTIHEDGDIVFQYADVTVGDSLWDFGRKASVGSENTTGSTGLQYMRGHPDSSNHWPGNRLRTGLAIRFWTQSAVTSGLPAELTGYLSLVAEPAIARRYSRIRYETLRTSWVL